MLLCVVIVHHFGVLNDVLCKKTEVGTKKNRHFMETGERIVISEVPDSKVVSA